MSDLKMLSGQETPTILDAYDVVILGAGMAGLSLAIQLKKARQELKVLIVEKQCHPVAETAHKVGESTVEIAAYYLRDVLDLQEHLQTQQIRKFGLRMFFQYQDNQDITRRVEYGQTDHAPLPAYQLDRGRLENSLGELVRLQGMTFLDGCKVQQVELLPQEKAHRVHILHENIERQISARWVIDATGRSSFLKRQLGLAKKVGHHANAAWFRIAHNIDIDQWSDDPTWRGRILEGQQRSLSTNHLMGPGYWVWIIPLASGSTSIGIVSDASMHPFDGMNRFDRALSWLCEHEPQCAAAIESHLDKVQDFHVMKDYSYSAQQVFSEERWCLIGEAAVAVDPLYSSGGDLIAVGNGLVTDLVARDFDGEDITERAISHNQIFLIFADVWLVAYEQQYPLMGNARVMVAKAVWDTIIYWAFPGLLYFHDKIARLSESPLAVANLYRCVNLHTRVQAFFREWHAIDCQPASDAFIDPYRILPLLLDLHTGMAAGLPDDELELQFGENARLLEQCAGQLVATVIEEQEARMDQPEVRQQVQLWRDDPFLSELIAIYHQDHQERPINERWITLGKRLEREKQEVAR